MQDVAYLELSILMIIYHEMMYDDQFMDFLGNSNFNKSSDQLKEISLEFGTIAVQKLVKN